MKIYALLSCMTMKCLASYPDETAIWPTNNIPVCWENVTDIEGMSIVRNALHNTWEKVSLVRFTGWNECTPEFVGVRIIAEDVRPKTVFLGYSEHMSWYRQPNTFVDFTFKNWYPECPKVYNMKSCIESVAVHEFGHILGFAHDQNRPDKPAWCTGDQFPANGNTTFLNYDEDSVMNYCNPVWSGLGVLSNGDVLSTQTYYGNISYYDTDSRTLELTNVNGFKVSLIDKLGNGEYSVTDSGITDGQSIAPQILNGDILTIPLGKVIKSGSVKALYKATMQRLSNGNWIFIDTQRVNI